MMWVSLSQYPAILYSLNRVDESIDIMLQVTGSGEVVLSMDRENTQNARYNGICYFETMKASIGFQTTYGRFTNRIEE